MQIVESCKATTRWNSEEKSSTEKQIVVYFFAKFSKVNSHRLVEKNTHIHKKKIHIKIAGNLNQRKSSDFPRKKEKKKNLQNLHLSYMVPRNHFTSKWGHTWKRLRVEILIKA